MKGIEGGILLLSGESISLVKENSNLSFSGTNFDDSPSGLRLSSELPKASKEYSAKDAIRMAIIATSWSDLEKRKALALKAMEDKAKWGFLMAQMVLLTDDTALPLQGKSCSHVSWTRVPICRYDIRFMEEIQRSSAGMGGSR